MLNGKPASRKRKESHEYLPATISVRSSANKQSHEMKEAHETHRESCCSSKETVIPSSIIVKTTKATVGPGIKVNKSFRRKKYGHLEEIPDDVWECVICKVKPNETPLKRRGPDGIRNLCNACYVRLRVRRERAERGISRPVIPVGGFPTSRFSETFKFVADTSSLSRTLSTQSLSSATTITKIKKEPKIPSPNLQQLNPSMKKKELIAAPPLIASAKPITSTTSSGRDIIDEQKKELENQKRLLDIQRQELFQACSQTEIPPFYIKEEDMHYEAPPTEFWTSSNDEFNILPSAADL